MLFHYVNGALMCEIRIPGLTRNMDQRFDYWWRDGSSPDSPNDSDYYGGYKHFVCESLPRSTAKRIVAGLGGYLIDGSYIPSGRQIGDGGPFIVHLFDMRNPHVLGEDLAIQDALDRAHLAAETWPVPYPVRIYDASGFMVIEIIKELGPTVREGLDG